MHGARDGPSGWVDELGRMSGRIELGVERVVETVGVGDYGVTLMGGGERGGLL